MSAELDTTSCESGPAGGSEGSADPEPPETGSSAREMAIDVALAIITFN